MLQVGQELASARRTGPTVGAASCASSCWLVRARPGSPECNVPFEPAVAVRQHAPTSSGPRRQATASLVQIVRRLRLLVFDFAVYTFGNEPTENEFRILIPWGVCFIRAGACTTGMRERGPGETEQGGERERSRQRGERARRSVRETRVERRAREQARKTGDSTARKRRERTELDQIAAEAMSRGDTCHTPPRSSFRPPSPSS
eukprot:2960845-Rhodomonas_salina.2